MDLLHLAREPVSEEIEAKRRDVDTALSFLASTKVSVHERCCLSRSPFNNNVLMHRASMCLYERQDAEGRVALLHSARRVLDTLREEERARREGRKGPRKGGGQGQSSSNNGGGGGSSSLTATHGNKGKQESQGNCTTHASEDTGRHAHLVDETLVKSWPSPSGAEGVAPRARSSSGGASASAGSVTSGSGPGVGVGPASSPPPDESSRKEREQQYHKSQHQSASRKLGSSALSSAADKLKKAKNVSGGRVSTSAPERPSSVDSARSATATATRQSTKDRATVNAESESDVTATVTARSAQQAAAAQINASLAAPGDADLDDYLKHLASFQSPADLPDADSNFFNVSVRGMKGDFVGVVLC